MVGAATTGCTMARSASVVSTSRLSQSTGKADAGVSIPHESGDDYTRYLEAGSIADYARKYNIENVPFVQKLFQNPAYTDFRGR